MENKPKHTPGPWFVCRRNKYANGNRRALVRHNDYDKTGLIERMIVICDCFADSASKERRANTALIAAAPELLQACKAALECSGLSENDDSPLYAQLTAVIDKAEGK